MPLKDLLWACPACRAVESIGLDGVCGACGAAYRRARGASIAGQGGAVRAPTEWLSALPWPDVDGEGTFLPAALEPPFEAQVVVRVAECERPLRRAGVFLGFVEVYGAKQQGSLVLGRESLSFRPRTGAGFEWPLPELTGIQPSSSAIQLKARARPLISMKFRAGSVRLWEQRLKYCTRLAYRAAGRGEIVEYQPWIRVR